MSAPVVTTYVRYFHPGIMVSEETVKPIANRAPQTAARFAPESAFAFAFFEKVTTTTTVQADGRAVELASKPQNESKRYYIDAEKLTEADVVALGSGYEALLANMRGNHWETMLRCRTGNYQPLLPGDEVVSSGAFTGSAR